MSASFAVGDAARWSGGQLRVGDARRRCAGVAIDSRRVAIGQLFVAIRGSRHDAHTFLDQATRRGAAALIVEAGRGPRAADTAGRCAVIEVADTTRALASLAAAHRRRFAIPVVAVTGSNGKTTTKEFAAHALAEAWRCLKSRGNWNNQYGLPLTLLELDASHRAAVVELGTNGPGEIAALAAVAQPRVGVVTNVGTAHMEFLGSRDDIAREKGALFAALPADGTAVANAEDERVLAQARRSSAPTLTFGRCAQAQVRAESIECLGRSGYRFTVRTPWGQAVTRIPHLAPIHVVNALAAVAAAGAAGVPLEVALRGLERATPLRGRLEAQRLPDGIWLLDDSYNANPQSVEVALAALCELRGEGRAVAALGAMGELGAAAPAAHRGVGERAASLGIDLLFTIGPHADATLAGARAGGMPAAGLHRAGDRAALAAALTETLRPGDWVLLKGSRSNQLERVAAVLRSAAEPRGKGA